MSQSFIKKIISCEEFEKVASDIFNCHKNDNEKYGHALGLKHDYSLIRDSLNHESLLIWNIHVWAHFNGKDWDGIFIGFIRKSEKFNKKIMDEYLWLSKNSNSGMRLYMEASKYAKENNCEYILMHCVKNTPVFEKLKKFYLKQGFEKDFETYIKKL